MKRLVPKRLETIKEGNMVLKQLADQQKRMGDVVTNIAKHLTAWLEFKSAT